MPYSTIHRFLRAKLKASNRKSFKVDDFFIKVYDRPEEAAYEYKVLVEIACARPLTFSVPQIFNFVKGTDSAFLTMDYVRGQNLQVHVERFLLFKDTEALGTFHLLGEAIRELHSLDINKMHYRHLPSSAVELRTEVERLTKRLSCLGILDNDLMTTIENLTESINPDRKIFREVNLYGEAYFVHILTLRKKFVLLDFHDAFKGPIYYDLATFNISLYNSLLLPCRSVVNLKPLTEAFLKGYFKTNVPVRSIRLSELYMTLRTIEALEVNSFKDRFITTLKLKKLKEAIKKVIIPQLVS